MASEGCVCSSCFKLLAVHHWQYGGSIYVAVAPRLHAFSHSLLFPTLLALTRVIYDFACQMNSSHQLCTPRGKHSSVPITAQLALYKPLPRSPTHPIPFRSPSFFPTSILP